MLKKVKFDNNEHSRSLETLRKDLVLIILTRKADEKNIDIYRNLVKVNILKKLLDFLTANIMETSME